MPLEFDREDHVPSRRPPKIVSLALIVLGGAAVVVPVLLLRRVMIPPGKSTRRLGNAPPPPIRRTSLRSSFQSSSDVDVSSPNSGNSSDLVPRRVPDFSPATLPLKTPAAKNAGADPLFSLKAFGIATCIVGLAAAAGVWTVRWTMDVQTIDQFSANMRHKLQSVAPALSARIHRSIAPSDSSQLSPLGSVAMDGKAPSTATEEPADDDDDDDDNLNWDETSDRLSRAYEEGGLPKWFEVVGLVMEREANIERKRREESRSRSD